MSLRIYPPIAKNSILLTFKTLIPPAQPSRSNSKGMSPQTFYSSLSLPHLTLSFFQLSPSPELLKYITYPSFTALITLNLVIYFKQMSSYLSRWRLVTNSTLWAGSMSDLNLCPPWLLVQWLRYSRCSITSTESITWPSLHYNCHSPEAWGPVCAHCNPLAYLGTSLYPFPPFLHSLPLQQFSSLTFASLHHLLVNPRQYFFSDMPFWQLLISLSTSCSSWCLHP